MARDVGQAMWRQKPACPEGDRRLPHTNDVGTTYPTIRPTSTQARW